MDTFRDEFPLKYCMISTSSCDHMLTISRKTDVRHVSRVTCVSAKFGALKKKVMMVVIESLRKCMKLECTIYYHGDQYNLST